MAIALCPGKLFACFQRRYSPFNELAIADLEVAPGEPISYHCIVYEVPIPARHWYRWPNSKSRIVSNGCHWIDHFLFLNRYATPLRTAVEQGSDGTVLCFLELDNGACFTMVLTDQGSERIGMQDYVELRANAVTIRIRNNSEYESEDRYRIRRRIRISKIRSYERMYRSIYQRIADGTSGDDECSILISSEAMLDLDEKLMHLHDLPAEWKDAYDA